MVNVGNSGFNDGATRAEKRLATQINHDLALNAKRFSDFDQDGDQALDFEEFYSMQPLAVRDMHTHEEIRTWFNAADRDGTGRLSISEFFEWSISNAALQHGASAVRTAFERFDSDGTGFLDAREFTAACKEMGFGSVAHLVFDALDANDSGAVSYLELGAAFGTDRLDVKTKSLLSALVWTYDTGTKDDKRHVLDTTRWKIRGTDAPSVRAELQTELQRTGAPVADLVKLFDVDATSMLSIDAMEFYNAMRDRFGYKGPKAVIDEVFRSMDTDGNGVISFDELFEFLRGRRHSLDERSKRVRAMQLRPPDFESCTLDDIEWDVNTLRTCILQSLHRCRAGPIDLMRAWDKSGDNVLSLQEWLREIRSMVPRNTSSSANDGIDDDTLGGERLWRRELRAVAEAAFRDVELRRGKKEEHESLRGATTTGDGYLDIVELQRWFTDDQAMGGHTDIRLKMAKSFVGGAEKRTALNGAGGANGSESLRRANAIVAGKAADDSTAVRKRSVRVVTIDVAASGGGQIHSGDRVGARRLRKSAEIPVVCHVAGNDAAGTCTGSACAPPSATCSTSTAAYVQGHGGSIAQTASTSPAEAETFAVLLPRLSLRQLGVHDPSPEASPRRTRASPRKAKHLNTPRTHADGTRNAYVQAPKHIPLPVSRELILSSCWSQMGPRPKPLGKPLGDPSPRSKLSPRRARTMVVATLLDDLDKGEYTGQYAELRLEAPMPESKTPLPSAVGPYVGWGALM